MQTYNRISFRLQPNNDASWVHVLCVYMCLSPTLCLLYFHKFAKCTTLRGTRQHVSYKIQSTNLNMLANLLQPQIEYVMAYSLRILNTNLTYYVAQEKKSFISHHKEEFMCDLAILIKV